MQRPTLIQAQSSVRDSRSPGSRLQSNSRRRYLRNLLRFIYLEESSGTPYEGRGKTKGFKEKIVAWQKDLIANNDFTFEEKEAINTLNREITNFLGSYSGYSPEWPIYSKANMELLLIQAFENACFTISGSLQDLTPIDGDAPVPFTGGDLLLSLEANAELMGMSQYIEPMLLRICTLLSDAKLKAVIACEDAVSDNDNAADKNATKNALAEWLNAYVCPSGDASSSITAIDLSLLPAELTHIIAAVVARLTLEALQRHRKLYNGQTLPTTLVMEEAHSFIKRYNDDGENVSASKACAQVFEKIAREGRKFGLGLILSSQRPSELSPTVLSQCNTFLLHRLTSDRDQELVAKLVPDSLRGLLRDLPSLPSQHAILLGWAAETPTLVRMNDLAKDQRPKSNDPNYWDVWRGVAERKVDWETVAQDWQGFADEPETPLK